MALQILVFTLTASTFFIGGFPVYCSALISVLLAVDLLIILRKERIIHFCLNGSSISVLAILAGYGLTIFWAVDHGMAGFGPVKYLPVFLYMLVLMQVKRDQIKLIYSIVPYLGAGVTAISFGFQYVPILSQYVWINGRLTGTFQYANTYALFLLIGVIVLLFESSGRKDYLKKSILEGIIGGILIFGIYASGSRTTLILLVVSIVTKIVTNRNKSEMAELLGIVLLAGILSALVSSFGLLESGRSLSAVAEPGTLLCRFLYFKDAVPVILKHPFGLGYLGYYTLQTSFQTGVYSVRYVHNELLQILLDTGWIPAILLSCALIRSFFQKGKSTYERIILFVICAHAMMDFDLQFVTIWFLLLPVMDLYDGRQITVEWRKRQIPVFIVIFFLMVLSAWMGLGDGLYHVGNRPACLRVTPFYTYAWMDELAETTSVESMEKHADKILSLSKFVPAAHSAKGSAALARGDILTMMEEKETAINLAPFYLKGYLDYFEQLYKLMQHYLSAGDTKSAMICRENILKIPNMLEQVKSQADPLAWKIQHKPELDLPEFYMEIIDSLS